MVGRHSVVATVCHSIVQTIMAYINIELFNDDTCILLTYMYIYIMGYSVCIEGLHFSAKNSNVPFLVMLLYTVWCGIVPTIMVYFNFGFSDGA